MRQSLQSFGISLFVVLAFIGVGIGFLPGMSPWISVVMVAVLIALPLIHKQITARRFVSWDDNLSVGIEMIDNDHKKLLTLINNLQTAVYYPTGEGFERQALEEVVNYTKYHFQREEDLMQKHGYPDYEAHKQQHEEMVSKVNGFVTAYEENREGAIEEATQFLKTWLINHIAGTDQRYTPYLREKGVR